MSLSEDAKAARREYMRKYREKNRKKYNQKIREWKEKNPDKVRQYNENYWNKVAAGGNQDATDKTQKPSP